MGVTGGATAGALVTACGAFWVTTGGAGFLSRGSPPFAAGPAAGAPWGAEGGALRIEAARAAPPWSGFFTCGCGGRGGIPLSLIPRSPGLFPKEGRVRGVAGCGRVTETMRIAGGAAGAGLEAGATLGADIDRGVRVATIGRWTRSSEGRIPRVLVGTQLAAFGWMAGPL